MSRNRLKYIIISCVLISAVYGFAADRPGYDPKGRRNPFIPLITPDGRLLKLDRQEGTSDLLLEGIIYDEHGNSYAIVNSEVVRVSDKVGDYQVLKIDKDKVTFAKDGEVTEVELKEEED